MKEGLFFGIILGMVAGAIVYRYSADVQSLADKGETMLKNEAQNIKKASAKKFN